MRQLEEFSHAQRERLAFIDFCLTYFGEISRPDLMSKFRTGLAAATRDFATYKALAPGNMELVHQTKLYSRKDTFCPIFAHEAKVVLAGLSHGFGNSLITRHKVCSACEDPFVLAEPSTSTLSVVMRAITIQKCLQGTYASLSSGIKMHTIVPHSLANSGKRWHVRAFDRCENTFSDFVITRFLDLNILDEEVAASETKDVDKQWNRIVDLTLIPHPKAQFAEAIELDYGMVNGELQVEVRAALAGYLLNHWAVDCSFASSLDPEQYHLALKHKQVIFGIENIQLAPGYEEVS